jgi:hypothetical protein
MNRTTIRLAAALGAAALLLPSAALAGKPDHAGKHAKKHAKKEHAGKKPSNWVFKGLWHADGTVTVSGGNARVRKNDLVGATLAFDLTGAKLRVDDTNADGAVTVADLVEGDKVVVKARLPRTDIGDGPYAAQRLVDQTHPVAEDDSDEAEAPAAPEAPAES